MDDPKHWLQAPEVVWSLTAAAGGVARYLHEWRQRGGPVVIGHIAAAIVTAAFTGLTFGKLAMLIRPEWADVATALGGWMGPTGMDVVARYVRRRFFGEKDKE